MALTPTLRQLLHAHIHLAPTAWAQAPASVRASFRSPFEPAQHLAQALGRLPPSLLAWWAELPSGHILIGDQRGYAPGRLSDDSPGRVNVAQIALAENRDEIAWARALFPASRSYLAVYDDHGLMRRRAVYAHCIHFDDADRALMQHTGSAAAVCPTSNLFLGSGAWARSNWTTFRASRLRRSRSGRARAAVAT